MTLHRQLPADRCLHLIARTPGAEVRCQAQAGELFDGLVRRPIFSQTNRVMGIDHNLPGFHECRHACGVTRILDKHQEGRRVRHKATVMSDAVGNGGHAKFTHAVVNIIASGIFFQGCRAFPDSQVAGREICRTTEQFRKYWPVGVQGILRSLATGDFGRISLQFGNVFLGCFFPFVGEFAAHPAGKLCCQFRVCVLVSREFRIPVLLRFFPFFASIPCPVNFFRDLKGRVMPAQFLTGQRHFLFTQRGAVRFFFTCLIGGAKTNHRPTNNQ